MTTTSNVVTANNTEQASLQESINNTHYNAITIPHNNLSCANTTTTPHTTNITSSKQVIVNYHTDTFANKEHLYNQHARALVNIVKSYNEKLEGNVFTLHGGYNQTDVFWKKRHNLYALATQLPLVDMSTRAPAAILEIGFNAGHSSLLYLLAHPQVHIYAFDICSHKYVQACCDYLNKHFGNRITLIPGDSTKTLPWFRNNYGVTVSTQICMYHVDGGHATHIARSDLENCYAMASHGTVIVMDDVHFLTLSALWKREYIDTGKVILLQEPFLKNTFHHAVGQFNKKYSTRQVSSAGKRRQKKHCIVS
jgi:hypothetical protein